jgi:hypothetical protein
MVLDESFADRKTAREARGNALVAVERLQAKQLGAMRAAADERRTAARYEAFAQLAAGTVAIAGAGLETSHDKDWSALGKVVGAGDGVTKGLVGLTTAAFKNDAEQEDAAAKEAEQAAGRTKTIADGWGDDLRAAQETARKALDFLKEYQSAQAQARAATMMRV